MGGPEFHAWYTLFVFVVIIAVIIWAYSRKNKDKFDRQARSIFDEDENEKPGKNGQKQESKNNE